MPTDVRARVKGGTWHAYRLTAREALSGARTATQLGMPVGTVSKSRSKVHPLLPETLRQPFRGVPPVDGSLA